MSDASAPGARRYETAIAAVQGVGALVLAWFTYDSIGIAGTRLAYAELWSSMLAVSGVAALGLAAQPKWRRELPWSLTGATMASSMMGRSLDIWWRIDEFSGRPALAVAIWATMSVSTVTTWTVVGSVTEALDNHERR